MAVIDKIIDRFKDLQEEYGKGNLWLEFIAEHPTRQKRIDRLEVIKERISSGESMDYIHAELDPELIAKRDYIPVISNIVNFCHSLGKASNESKGKSRQAA